MGGQREEGEQWLPFFSVIINSHGDANVKPKRTFVRRTYKSKFRLPDVSTSKNETMSRQTVHSLPLAYRFYIPRDVLIRVDHNRAYVYIHGRGECIPRGNNVTPLTRNCAALRYCIYMYACRANMKRCGILIRCVLDYCVCISEARRNGFSPRRNRPFCNADIAFSASLQMFLRLIDTFYGLTHLPRRLEFAAYDIASR